MSAEEFISVVIVTFNRRQLLERCLKAIAAQTHRPSRVFVVDNASSDGTANWLTTWLPDNIPNAQLLALEENLGGAGGFATGMKAAADAHDGWIWIMDDDASAHPTALEELMRVAADHNNIYGSLATNGRHTAWETTLLDPERRRFDLVTDIPASARVESLPFLGFAIHSRLASKIGLPDAGYFIAADDVEYCLRARKAGARIFIAGRSRIEHPRAHTESVRLLGQNISYLKLPPWKRYYDTRNRILVARSYHGLRLFTQTIPGTLARLFIALSREPDKLGQLRACVGGMVDGLLGRKGRRHAKWRVSP